MATREAGGVGIDHLTVVPEDRKAESTPEDAPDGPAVTAADDDEAE